MYGGSGGVGGSDNNSGGIVGQVGIISGSIPVRPGDTITIAIGGGGMNGGGGATSNTSGCVSQSGTDASSGKPGTNPIATAGSSSSYNGGQGGKPAIHGCSGPGGGGGAATVMHISGRGYYIAAGGGGSGGANSSNDFNTAYGNPVPSSSTSRTRADNGTNLFGGSPGWDSTNSNTDGGGSGGGGGGYHGGASTDPITGYNEVVGVGGSAGSNYVQNSTDNTNLTVTYGGGATQTSGCHVGSNTWGHYGCGVDGSVTLVYAPTPTLTQTDSNNASVQSTDTGTVYLVNETVSVSALSDITSLPSTLMVATTISTANLGYNVSLSGLSPGTYVAYAYSPNNGGLLSRASRTTVAAGGMCTLTTAPGLTYSYAYRLGYCYVTFMSGTGTWNVPSGVTNVSFLAVGGGGGGGENGASGGGGGALQDISYYTVPSGGTVSVTVGNGGAGGATSGVASTAGSTGGASIFGTYTANGGGGGNSSGGQGGVGGAGGAGGTSAGGAGSVGSKATGGNPGNADTGPSSSILGKSNNYSGGGAGGDWQGGIGTPGTGGGWSGIELQQGASYNNAPTNIGGNGLPNTGGGGGGGATNYGYGGSGGSGVVIVRYIATNYKPSAPASPTIYPGDTTTFTSTAPNLFSGITRTIRWQVSYDTGTTWTNVDTGTVGLSSTYTTPSETNTTLIYWFRAQITDTTSTYSFVTTSDTATIIFVLRNSSDTDTAMNFTGSQSLKTTAMTYSNSSGGTVEVWVKPDAASCTASVNATVLYKPNSYWIFCNGNKWGGVVTDGTNTSGNGAFGNFAIHSGEWTHLALVYNGTYLYSYLNGQLVDTQTTSYSAGAAATPWYVGCSVNTATDYFTGQIDELKIWTTTRTAAQIAIDMDTYTATNSANLYAYYDFNEGSGSLAFNRDTPRTGGTLDLAPATGSTTYTYSLIESTTVTGNYKVTQFVRTIITAAGGWKIPKQVNTAMALVVGGGGGGGGNAGSGGAGGAGVKGVAPLRTSTAALRVKVGQGGAGALLSSGNYFNGQVGRTSTISLSDASLNVTANGGSAGLSHWLESPCSTGTTVQNGTIAGGTVASTTGLKNSTSSVGGNGGTTPPTSGNIGGTGGSGFTSTYFTGSHLYGGGGGGGSWGVGTYSVGGGDNGLPRGGKGGSTPDSGDRGAVATGNGGGGAGNNSCNYFGGEGGSGTVLLKYLVQDTISVTGPSNDTYTAGARYTFQVTASAANGNLTRSYQWQSSSDTGTTWANVSTGTGYLTNTYLTPVLDTSTSGPQFLYRCLVFDSDTDGVSIFATSGSAYINVLQSASIVGSATISTTYGTRTTSNYTPLNGLPTRKFSMVAGSYGGYLDPTLNGVGYETNTFTQGNSYANVIATNSDGSVIVAGQTTASARDNFSLMKMSSAGVLDSTFGTSGRVVTNMGAKSLITALTIDPVTGAITAVGQAAVANANDGAIAIARYSSTGALDTSFATIGYETITIANAANTGNYVSGVAIQSDGKILISASRLNLAGTTDSATILRLTSSGAIDNTFGSSGYSELAWGAGYNYTFDFAIQSDGKILVAGQEQDTNSSGNRNYAISRLLANGAIDSTYANSGTAIIAPPCASCFYEGISQIAPDNSVYFASNLSATPANLYLTHINSDGTQDLNFGTNGFITETTTTTCRSLSILVNSPGIVAVTCTIYSTNYTNYIYLYDTAGARVSAFASGGIFNTTVPTGGLNTKSQLTGYPVSQFFTQDSSNNYWLVGTVGSNYGVIKVMGNSTAISTQSPYITLDTTTSEVGKIVVDSATSAGTYYQTVIVTDSASVVTSKLVTISVAKAAGVTITASSPSSSAVYSGDTLTTSETITTSGLVAGDTLTVGFLYKAPSTDTLTAVKVIGDTFTITPIRADTFTITPTVSAISHGSVRNGILSNYLSTTYVTGTLKVNRGTRSNFALNTSTGFAYAVVGAPLKIVVLGAMDTGTITFTVSGANCTFDTNTLLLTDTATTAATCSVSATIARTSNWDTATAQTTIYFQAYINDIPYPSAGTGPTIALQGKVNFTVESLTAGIASAYVTSYDSVTTKTFILTVSGAGFGTDPTQFDLEIGMKLPVAVLSVTDTLATVKFSTAVYGDGTDWGTISLDLNGDIYVVPKEFISGPTWSYSSFSNA